MTAFIWFIYRMCFQVSYKITFHWQSLGTFVALICFSPVCILKCPISWILFKKHCHILCISMVPPQCEPTYVSQKYTEIWVSVWYDIIYISKIVSELNYLPHILHWKIFLLWFIQENFTFLLHWNNTQDISKYLWIQDFATCITLKEIFCCIFHIFIVLLYSNCNCILSSGPLEV